MSDNNVRNLACAVIMQAVRDYFRASKNNQKEILKELRSTWMQALSDGTSVIIAEQLELRPEEIAARMRQHHEIV